MNTLRVSLEERSYPIHIGAGLLGDRDLFQPLLRGPQVLVVSNETVAPLFMDRLTPALAGREVCQAILPDGEQHKTLETLSTLFDALLEARFARDCTVVALGGGVVGDVAGFAAASYQRGVRFVQVPTTLLAQVDSSVGGKTAVNHPRGKNMIGAFHQPAGVLTDTETLATLPARELAAGLAEVIKYGLIRDQHFFEWLEDRLDDLLARDEGALGEAILRSCAVKAAIVSEDERETGNRALLNLGHTFGHAIEAGLGFGAWLHGEAVAAGMCMAADLSARLGWLNDDDVQRIRDLLARADLPVNAPGQLAPDALLELMGRDKKVAQGRLRLVLMRGIGSAVVTDGFDPRALAATLETCRQAA